MRASAVRVDDDALDLIAEATAAACGIDRRHRIVYWNDAMAALLGWTSRDALGRNCYDVFAGHDVFGNICCFQDCGVAVAVADVHQEGRQRPTAQKRDGTPLRLVTRTVAVPSPGAAYRCLVHLFEHGDGAALATILTRLRSVVAPKPEPPTGPAVERHASVTLTRREHEVLEFIAAGYGSVNIAARLGLSHATVRSHVQRLLRRLEVHSQAEAVSVAFRRGLLGGDEDGGDGRIRTDE